ncbi:MAG: hypothetical protein P4M11_02290 [Candidatus Pacebacteria bacterium]|nr:hypothetical protein [Candidatus Paceibacterota bacterium]
MVKYVCLTCKNLPLCETCELEHASETGHAPVDCKEVGLAFMYQHIKYAGGILAKEMVEDMRRWLKELEAAMQREIDSFESCFAQSDECLKMQKLEKEERYAELYFYAKDLPMGDVKNAANMQKLKKHLRYLIEVASRELEKLRVKIDERMTTPQYKPVFAAYKKDEVLMLSDKFSKEEENVLPALKSADMSKFKAVYIDSWNSAIEDRVAPELASRLETNPVSALYLSCRISDASAGMLAQVAFRNKSLSAFCIDSGNVSDTGAKAVAESVRNCSSLTTFYLNGDHISDSGAKAVIEAVKGCPLSVFHLGGSEISDSGAKVAAEAVKGCPLSVFSLIGSRISGTGAKAVAEEILSGGCARTISAFYLSSGCISDLDVVYVADTIKRCPLLSSFYMDGHAISGTTVVHILKGMPSIGTIIRSVNLYVVEISNEQMDSCLDLLQQSGAGKRLKLRFQCHGDPTGSVCEKSAGKWNLKLFGFRVVPAIFDLFEEEIIRGAQS